MFLKRCVHQPLRRRAGVTALPAALLTFGASGLLHEYNFALHNAAGYVPGHATLFFVAMGLLMLAEAAAVEWTWARCPSRVRAAVQAVPSPLVALALRLAVLPLFAPLFFRSWEASGLYDALREMLPHVARGGGIARAAS